MMSIITISIMHAYLVGEQFTLPDAYLFVMLRWAIHFKLDLSEWSNLASYFMILNNRTSVRRSLSDE